MHYLITGGTGFIGKNFIASLDKTDSVTVLSRNIAKVPRACNKITTLADITPDTKIDVIINLAGSPINQRWNDAVKQELINSRINTTQALVKLLTTLSHTPAVMINASAIGYYQPDSSFSHKICALWEQAANTIADLNIDIRLCIMRLGVVLGKKGGAIKKMSLPFKLGLGGKLGSGEQMFSWIHINDVIAAIKYFIRNPNSCGTYDVTSPYPITNLQFTKALGAAVRRPTICTMPAWIIKLLFGEMGEELLLSEQKVIPDRLIAEKFQFTFPTIESALQNIFA